MEWEVDYWGRFGKWGLPFLMIFSFAIMPTLFAMWATGGISDFIGEFIAGLLIVNVPILIIVLGTEWFPVRYYQKITASGFYSYGFKVGSTRRKKMAVHCMMGGLIIAVILLFIAGPFVFIGAGASALSFLSLGKIPEPEPEESAWPWLGMYSLVLLKKPFLYNLYKVSTQGDSYLILTKEELEKVKEIMKQYGQHEIDILDKEEESFYDRWWQHQDTMPFRQVEAANSQMSTTEK